MQALDFKKYDVFEWIDQVALKAGADVIVANRLSEELKDVEEKVYTQDVFSRD